MTNTKKTSNRKRMKNEMTMMITIWKKLKGLGFDV